MASIYPHGTGYRVQLCVRGRKESKVCKTRKEAAQWALEREAELSGAKLPDKTLKDASEAYRRAHEGRRGDCVRLVRFEREDALAGRRLASLDAGDFNTWRDARLRVVKPGTVARELNTLRSVLEYARLELRWIRANPMRDVRWPKTPKGRARGITSDEVTALAEAFCVAGSLQGVSVTQRGRVGLAFLLALETAMRSGEICALTWADIHLPERYVSVRKSKNGDARDVPLSSRAVELIEALPKCFGPAFRLSDSVRDAIYRKHRPKALKSIHFHDTRSEAISRLSKKLDIYELARVVGHRDLNSLLHYYKATASELSKRLG